MDRKTVDRLLLVLAHVLGLLFCLVVSVTYHAQLRQTRSLVAQLVSHAVSGELKGSLRLGEISTLGPWGIGARDVVIRNHRGEAVVHAERVHVSFGLWQMPLITPGGILIDRVSVKGVRLLLERERTGAWNVEELLETGEPSTGPSLLRLRVQRLTVERASATVRDVLGTEVNATDLSMAGQLNFDRGRLSARWFGGNVKLQAGELRPTGVRLDQGRLVMGDVVTVKFEVADGTGGAPSMDPSDRSDAKLVPGTACAVAYSLGEAKDLSVECDVPWTPLSLLDRAGPPFRVSGTERLRGSARGLIQVSGTTSSPRIMFDGETSGGALQLSLEMGETPRVRATTSRLRVDQVVRGVPEVTVDGVSEVTLPRGNTLGEVRLQASRVAVEGFVFQRVGVEADLEPEMLRLRSVKSRSLGGDIYASGTVTTDGDVRTTVRFSLPQVQRELNVRRLIGLDSGRAFGEVSVRMDRGDMRTLTVQGRVSLDGGTYGAVRASSVVMDGRWTGGVEHPRIDARLIMDGATLFRRHLGHLEASLEGGPTTFAMAGEGLGPDGQRFRFGGDVKVSTAGVEVDASELTFSLGEHSWRGEFVAAVDPDQHVQLKCFELRAPGQSLYSKGSFRFSGPEQMEFRMDNFDVNALAWLLNWPWLTSGGRLDLNLRMAGDLSNPDLQMSGALRNAQVFDAHDASASFDFHHNRGDMALVLDLGLGTQGSLNVQLNGLMDPEQSDWNTRWKEGVYEGKAVLGGLDTHFLENVLGERTPSWLCDMRGHVNAQWSGSGSPLAPTFDVHFGLPDLMVGERPPMGLRGHVNYALGALVGRVVASDREGDLMEAEGSLVMDVVQLVTQPELVLDSLSRTPWRVSFRQPKRELGDLLSHVYAAGTAPPQWRLLSAATVSGTATLAGGSFKPHADLHFSVDMARVPAFQTCAGPAPRIVLNGTLKQGIARGHAQWRNTQGAVAEAYALHALDLGEMWGAEPFDGQNRPSATETANRAGSGGAMMEVKLNGLRFADVPWLCDVASGQLWGNAYLTGLFHPNRALRASIKGEGITMRGAGRRLGNATMEMTLRASPEDLRSEAKLSWQAGASAELSYGTDIRWPLSAWAPQPERGSGTLSVSFHDAPLGGLLQQLSSVRRADGLVSGDVTVRSPLLPLWDGGRDLDDTAERSGLTGRFSGELAWKQGRLKLGTLGHDFRRVRGRVRFTDEEITLEDTRLEEGSSFVTLAGRMALSEFPYEGSVQIHAEDFAARQDGAVVARLTTDAESTLSFDEESGSASVTLKSLEVRLPEKNLRAVQSLETHRDIEVIRHSEGESTDQEAGDYPFHLSVASVAPFWIRREDFQTYVAAAMDVSFEDNSLRVGGVVDLQKGWFEVMGKRFVLDRGLMTFDGTSKLDPLVNITAEHTLRSMPDTTITVVATGRLSNLDIQFLSNHPECRDHGAVIGMLLSGRCASRSSANLSDEVSANQQAEDFLAGLLAGVLTLTAREELGDVLPVITIESGDAAFRSARIRAGFNANALIPKFLRPVVRGAYVEGIFTASEDGNTANSNQSLLPGFFIELQFPASLVGAGQFNPPDSWSADVTWQP